MIFISQWERRNQKSNCLMNWVKTQLPQLKNLMYCCVGQMVHFLGLFNLILKGRFKTRHPSLWVVCECGFSELFVQETMNAKFQSSIEKICVSHSALLVWRNIAYTANNVYQNASLPFHMTCLGMPIEAWGTNAASALFPSYSSRRQCNA